MTVPLLANSTFVPDAAIVVMAFALGACVGSFLNVVIWRLPRRCLSLVRPGSHCPGCKAPINWYDNVPVLAWFWLRGKCRACGTRISFRYPLVEALTGGLFAVVVWLDVLAPDAVGNWQAWLLAVTHMVFISLMIAAAFIDADLTVIPEEINWGGTAVILLFALANPIHGGVSGTSMSLGETLPEGVTPAATTTMSDLSDFPGLAGGRLEFEGDLPITHITVVGIPGADGPRDLTFRINTRVEAETGRRFLQRDGLVDPVPGMPAYIRVLEQVYRLEFHASPAGYWLHPVGTSSSSSGGERAQVGHQWPVDGWFSDDASGFTSHLQSFLGALFGALIAGGGMWLLRATATGFLIKKALLHGQGAAMGMGDVKLLMLFGAMLGWGPALLSIFVGAGIALLVTVPMLLMKKQHLFPFGPFLAMAAVAILLLEGPLMTWLVDYFSVFVSPAAGV